MTHSMSDTRFGVWVYNTYTNTIRSRYTKILHILYHTLHNVHIVHITQYTQYTHTLLHNTKYVPCEQIGMIQSLKHPIMKDTN